MVEAWSDHNQNPRIPCKPLMGMTRAWVFSQSSALFPDIVVGSLIRNGADITCTSVHELLNTLWTYEIFILQWVWREAISLYVQENLHFISFSFKIVYLQAKRKRSNSLIHWLIFHDACKRPDQGLELEVMILMSLTIWCDRNPTTWGHYCYFPETAKIWPGL